MLNDRDQLKDAAATTEADEQKLSEEKAKEEEDEIPKQESDGVDKPAAGGKVESDSKEDGQAKDRI